MRLTRSLWILTPLALLLMTAAACNEAGGDAVLGPSTAESVEEGIELSADPAQILLDPNDPNAPRDPNTDKLIGSTTIAATVRDALGEPQVGVEVTFTTTKGTLASGGQPLTTDAEGKVVETLSVTEDDAGDVEVTAVSGEFTETIVVPVVLVPLNVPPTADAGEDQIVECPDGVTLDGSGSTDSNSTEGTNDDIVLYEWYLDDEKIAEGMTAVVTLPLGVHEITLRVTDKAGATDEDTVMITVQDTTPPVVTLKLSPPVLWPPNHKMRDIHATLEIVEECDPEPVIEIVSVTSNEPDNGLGDGDTENDIQGVEVGTADMDFALRAERQGMGNNRLYTVVYRVTDASGNATEAEATVTVPHDRGH
jgi:hypothetical protein